MVTDGGTEGGTIGSRIGFDLSSTACHVDQPMTSTQITDSGIHPHNTLFLIDAVPLAQTPPHPCRHDTGDKQFLIADQCGPQPTDYEMTGCPALPHAGFPTAISAESRTFVEQKCSRRMKANLIVAQGTHPTHRESPLDRDGGLDAKIAEQPAGSPPLRPRSASSPTPSRT